MPNLYLTESRMPIAGRPPDTRSLIGKVARVMPRRRRVWTSVEHNAGVEPTTSYRLGVSRSVVDGDRREWPLHGLRHVPESDITGWYL